MRSITQLKGLGDMRTTISTHVRSTPRQQGSTYLEVYLLDKEQQRLGTELAMLDKRQRRVETRLGEIRQAIEKLRSGAQPVPSGLRASGPEAGLAARGGASQPGRWSHITLQY